MTKELEALVLPGLIPGLIRECSPVTAFGVNGAVLGRDTREKRHGDWTVAPVDEWPDGSEWADMARSCRPDEMALRLTDATGRAHAAWWLANRYYGSGHVAVWYRDVDGARWCLHVVGPAPAGASEHPEWACIDHLDPDDPRTLPDGSRWVDAEALRLVCLHVAEVSP